MNKKVRKLSLNKETLRSLESNLSERDLQQVAGGVSCTCRVNTFCPCTDDTCRGDCC